MIDKVATRMKPRGSRILIEPEDQEKTSGGILLPSSARKLGILRGTVAAVGDGSRSPLNGELSPCRSVKGEIVLFASNAGMELQDEDTGITYFIIEEEAILCALE